MTGESVALRRKIVKLRLAAEAVYREVAKLPGPKEGP